MFFGRILIGSGTFFLFGILERNDVIEDRVILHRDMAVEVAFSEVPLLKMTDGNEVFKERMNFEPLHRIDAETVLKGSGRFMGNDIIYGLIMVFKDFRRCDNFLTGWLFLFPPVCGGTEFKILTMAAAEGKEFLSADRIDLTAEEVDEVGGDDPSGSAVPAFGRIFFEEVEILVTAINETDRIFQLLNFPKQLLFFFGIVPDKPEIAADDQEIVGVSFFEQG